MFIQKHHFVVPSILLFLCQMAFAHAEIKSLPLVQVKSETAKVKKICSSLKIECSDEASIWKIMASTDSKYYLIDRSLQLVELNKTNHTFKMLNRWNFSLYEHSSKTQPDDDLDSFGTEIFPALYPLNHDKFAVAIVKQYGRAYSGGGKGEHIADFVMLEPNGQYRTALAQIPFYSYEAIRACFSEAQYKTSPHCHDESGSTLSIDFKDIGQPYYQWTLNYTDYNWDAFKAEKFKRIEKRSEVVMPLGKEN